MKKSTPPPTTAMKPPSLPNPGSTPKSTIAELVDEDSFARLIFTGNDLSFQEATNVTIEEARFNNVRFAGSILQKLALRDARLDTCDLSNAEWNYSRITRVEIDNARLTGFRATDTKFSNCKFTNCVGKLIQLQTAQFDATIFQNCNLAGCDFRFCNLESVVFDNCDLQEAVFYDANLKNADFRGSNLLGILAHARDLAGAIISRQQALDFATHFANLLGMQVVDE